MSERTPGRDRRRLKRVVKRIPAAFEAGALRGKGHVKNVSKGGLFLRTPQLPTVGDSVRVLFHGRDGSKVEVRGRVAWTTEQLQNQDIRPGFGVRFETAGPEYVDFFEQILTY